MQYLMTYQYRWVKETEVSFSTDAAIGRNKTFNNKSKSEGTLDIDTTDVFRFSCVAMHFDAGD